MITTAIGLDPRALGLCPVCRQPLQVTASGQWFACAAWHGRLQQPGTILARRAYTTKHGLALYLAGGRGVGFAPRASDSCDPTFASVQVFTGALPSPWPDRLARCILVCTRPRIYAVGVQVIFPGPVDRCQRCHRTMGQRWRGDRLRIVRRRAPANAKPRALCGVCRRWLRGQLVYVTGTLPS